MKKFVLVLGLLIAFTAAVIVPQEVSAQVTLRSEYGLASDTVVNTGTVVLSARVTGSGTLAVQATVTEISGTTAGTLTLLGSLDNVNYSPLDSVTFTAADVATPQSFIWKMPDTYTPYVRVSYTGSGTMSAILTAQALVRRRN